MLIFSTFFYLLINLFKFSKSTDVDLDHVIKGDEVWLNVPNKINFAFDKSVKDLPYSSPNLFSSTHGYKTTLSLPRNCYLSRSSRAGDGSVFVTHLCPENPSILPTNGVSTNQIIVTHQINSDFKSVEYKRITTSLFGKCNDMIHYHDSGTTTVFQMMVIACAESANSTNANVYVYFYDPVKNSISSLKRTISGNVKFSHPQLILSTQTTTLGINRPYAVILDQLDRNVYCAFEGSLSSQTFVSNLDIIFVDITAKTVSGLSLSGKVDLTIVVDFVAKNNRIFFAGYKQTSTALSSREARIYECPISRSLSATSCSLKTTGFKMSSGPMKLGIDTTGNDDRLYFYEDSSAKAIVAVCKINLLQTSGQIDSECKYQKSMATTSVVFLNFTQCTQIGCQLIYGTNPTTSSTQYALGIDYLSYNATSPSAGYLRFRQQCQMITCADFVKTSITSTNTLSNNPYADVPYCFYTTSPYSKLIAPSVGSFPKQDLDITTSSISTGAYSQTFQLVQVSTNSTLSHNLRLILSTIQKNAKLPTMPSNLPILKNQLYLVPIKNSDIIGNNLNFTISSTNSNLKSIIQFNNTKTITINTKISDIQDQHYFGGGFIGFGKQIKSGTAGVLAYYQCTESLQFTGSWLYKCDVKREVSIKGYSQGVTEWNNKVANGQASSGDTPQYDYEQVISVRVLDRVVICVTQRTIDKNWIVHTFSKSDYTHSQYSLTSGIEFIDFAEVNDYLYFTYNLNTTKKVTVMRSTLLKIESATTIKEITQLYRSDDLCPIGLNMIGGSTPRLKFVNFCGTGQKGILYDFEITTATTTFRNNYIENLMDKPTVSTKVQMVN